jgi:DNA (cytosine-5)-methyltransferase 1
MNELSLFSGAGGGLLGTKLLGWRNIGYVEHERYCQQIISQRIKDGILDEAPIFGDIDSFIESGAAKKYKGFVDVVTAGFPCQPFSVAGKQAGEDDPRNKWPQTIQCIRDIRPRYAFLENVPGLLNSGYFPEILGSLAEAGFDARWVVLGADDVGAPHRRKRLWILADSDSIGLEKYGHSESTDAVVTGQVADPDSDDGRPRSGTVAQGRGSRLEHRRSSTGQPVGRPREDVADSDTGHGIQSDKTLRAGGLTSDNGSQYVYNAENPSRPWSTEPQLGRVAHGVAHRVDRLKAIGNGQVPLVVAQAWGILK